MRYQDTINWMFSQLPMYQRQGKSAYKTDLSNIQKLSQYLKYPEQKFKSIHVAGTNGKGSTSHMLASVLQEAGYKVGLYTSPHLKDFRERIKINGKDISKQFVIGFVKKHQLFFEENTLSFFEMTVGMAFNYFAKKKVDIAIIEVGLGGRLDSTNIITPELSVITNIGLDHQQFLGDTLENIAVEKAGIIKKTIPVVVGETQTETTPVFKTIASQQQAKIYFADQLVKEVCHSDLKGSYQEKNIKTVIQSIRILNKIKYSISRNQLQQGLLKVVTNTGLKGRWQILQDQPKVICDIAHNRDGLSYTMTQLKSQNYNNLHVVLGFVNDKDISSVLDLFPKQAEYYFCKARISRAMDADAIESVFLAKGYPGKAYKSVVEAFQKAIGNAKKEDIIYVGGSTFVVAEII